MKSAPLLIEEIHFIDRDSISPNSTDAEILNLIGPGTLGHHTPGTATLSSEKKFSTSGEYYQNEIAYTSPGYIAEEYNTKISKAGALVVTTDDNRKIVFHKNDLYQNAFLRININKAQDKTQIKLSINTINSV